MERATSHAALARAQPNEVATLSGDGVGEELLDPQERQRSAAKARLLWERRGFLCRIVVWGLASATAIAFLIPSRYQSTVRLMPPDGQSGSGLATLAALTARTGGGLEMLAGDLLGIKNSGALFVGILRSRTVQERLVDRFDLRKVYWVRRREDARKRLAGNTELVEDRKSGIITATVTDKSPQRAAAMGQAYVEELNRLVAELTTSAAHRERVFIEERLKEVKQDLDAAARDFSQFTSRNAVIDIKDQSKAMVDAAATLQGHIIAAQSELEGLKHVYAANNVRVRTAKVRLAELQRHLDRLGGKPASDAGGPSHEEESLYPSIRKLPLLGVVYADLYRRMKIQEAVFETLTRQHELAKVQEAKEIPAVKVLDPANVPEKKSFPPRLLIALLGTLLSLLCGTAWVLGSARWADTDSQDPRKALAREVFAALNARKPWGSQNGSSPPRDPKEAAGPW